MQLVTNALSLQQGRTFGDSSFEKTKDFVTCLRLLIQPENFEKKKENIRKKIFWFIEKCKYLNSKYFNFHIWKITTDTTDFSVFMELHEKCMTSIFSCISIFGQPERLVSRK